MAEWLFFVIGLLYTFKGLLAFATYIKIAFSPEQWRKYGKSWALVTACTDGIGLGFSLELAKHGFNIIQVGRNPEKLIKTAKKIQLTYNVHVKSIIKDFSECHQNPKLFFEDISKQCEDFDVSILVNNVGMLEAASFLSSEERIIQQNALNLFPLVMLSKVFMKKLRSRKNGAGIINLSSLTGEYPFPFMGVYSAAKSFGKVFSEIVSYEEKIDVLCLMPGHVWTPLGSQFYFKCMSISKEECATIGLRALGNGRLFVGHGLHFISYVLIWASHLLFGPIRKMLLIVFDFKLEKAV